MYNGKTIDAFPATDKPVNWILKPGGIVVQKPELEMDITKKLKNAPATAANHILLEIGFTSKGEYIQVTEPLVKTKLELNDATIKGLVAETTSLAVEAKKGKVCKADLTEYKSAVHSALDKFRDWTKDTKILQ
jgi:hypothetical protein